MTDIAELQLLRCDAECPARGVVKVVLLSGNDLRFCGHHYDKFAASLATVVGAVEDERVTEKETAEVSV